MGREVRMVPPNWDHPMVNRPNGEIGYQPMLSSRFEDAVAEWKAEFAKWEAGERPEGYGYLEFWEYWGMPPDRRKYRPWANEEATWYQVWETVSEGTPVTPPFATREELIVYLVANGDFWDQLRRKERSRGIPQIMSCEPWSRETAENFVNGRGRACSFVINGTGIHRGVDV